MKRQSMRLGFGEIEVGLGAHICAFYQGPVGRDEVLVPFLAEGARQGDKCVGVVESTAPQTVWDQLTPAQLAGTVPGQVDVTTPAETYLRGGHFDTDDMMGWLDEMLTTAVSAEGYSRVRSAGEMAWALSDLPGVDGLFDYETRLNRFAPSYPQVMLCLYDLDRVSGAVLVEAMKTHPQILVGTMLCESPFYEPSGP